MKQKNIRLTVTTIVNMLCVLIMLFSLSCREQNNPIYELVLLRDEIKVNSVDYSNDDWQNVADKYTDICSRINDMPLSQEELLEIDKIKGEIVGYMAKNACQDFFDDMNRISEEMSSFIDGFVESFNSQE